jgi:hypothetical protein
MIVRIVKSHSGLDIKRLKTELVLRREMKVFEDRKQIL